MAFLMAGVKGGGGGRGREVVHSEHFETSRGGHCKPFVCHSIYIMVELSTPTLERSINGNLS